MASLSGEAPYEVGDRHSTTACLRSAGLRILSVARTARVAGARPAGTAEDAFGAFYAYVPTTAPANAEVLVLVHGTPLKERPAEWNADYDAINWIADIAAYAEANGRESHFELGLVPGLGHDMTGLLPYSQNALAATDS